ncbi:aminopeptidase P family protein [Helcococcus ovis]|uniref:aminopeptidase P family protein n=1 Tax=Helcococcus ovis TaxID=72026 RepID=UPI0038B701A3
MSIYDRVDNLRDLMMDRDIEAYIVPTSDPHQSEYLSDYYKTREYISGFTGSAGTAVITRDKAGLWTDGRYFVQAENELKNSPFKLYRMGEDIDYLTFINEEVSQFGKVAVDGRCLSLAQYDAINDKLGDRLLITDVDFISNIWENRPQLSKSEAWIFDEKYTGKSVSEKLKEFRKRLREKDCDYGFIGALEDIAYLFNLRGDDIYATPVFFSYALISHENAILFIDENKIDLEVKEYLKANNIDIYRYDAIFNVLNEIRGSNSIYLDPNRTNVKVYQSINKNVRIKRGINLTTLMKMIKNEIEIENEKKAFHKDAIALTKFFNWVETGVKSGAIDEVFAAKKLLSFREQQENFIEPSFTTISAYGANAAMPHYDPEKVIPATLQTKGLYLVDSGAQYLEGTTDITRTIALGELTYDEKLHYTLTLKGFIAGLSAKFKNNSTGYFLDSIVRNPIYRYGLDFNHGTGHGVGFVLGVHEGPMSISKKDNGVVLQKGMIFSIEPGLYIEGAHGIRIENIVYVEDAQEPNMLEIKTLLYLPIDTRPVLKELLEVWELDWLNSYNEECYNRLSKELDGDDLIYLRKITREL